jgi:hypothetical protein
MATLLKVLINLADIKSAGVLHFASEFRRCEKIIALPGAAICRRSFERRKTYAGTVGS